MYSSHASIHTIQLANVRVRIITTHMQINVVRYILSTTASSIFLLWKKSAIAISTVALLLFQISIFCINAEMDGCIEGTGKGDFLVERDVLVEITAPDP